MPGATSIRCNARWNGSDPGASSLSRRDDRLHLVWEAGALPPLPDGPIAVMRARPTGFFAALGRERFLCQQGDRAIHDALAAEGLAVATTPPETAAAAIVMTTRQRADSLGAVATALDLLPGGAPLLVTGARGDGIDAILKAVATALPLGGSLSKAHGRVFFLHRPETLPEPVASWRNAYRLRPNAAGFLTGPGMFGPDAPDPGSVRLARHVAGRLAGRVADLGAGWGWLAAAALAGSPAIEEIHLHEAEARALEAARLNLTDPRAHFHWTDVTRMTDRAGYDWVITNPPFHRGRAAEPTLGAAFIAAAARILRPGGRLVLVANRNLPYEAPLARAFREVRPLAEDNAFKVIEAARPIRR
jgi:16S rRNA (guanine1207-N2)-methyltransferase